MNLEDDDDECEDDIEEVTDKHFVLSKHEVNKYYVAFSDDLITIGGKQSSICDSFHLNCPICNRKMKHLAQIQGNSINFYEGSLYINVCEECKTAGIIYDQT